MRGRVGGLIVAILLRGLGGTFRVHVKGWPFLYAHVEGWREKNVVALALKIWQRGRLMQILLVFTAGSGDKLSCLYASACNLRSRWSVQEH